MRRAGLACYEHLATHVDAQVLLFGRTADWQAPIAIFDAPNGFGDDAWMTAVPETILGYWLGGTPVMSHAKGSIGRMSSAALPVALHPRGTCNACTCDGPVRFAQVFIPDPAMDRVASDLGRGPVSGSLRDDLYFVEDERLRELAAGYIARGRSTIEPPTRLEMDTRLILLLERLIGAHHGQSVAPVRGGLAPWQIRRTRAFMSDRLGQDMSLADLAAAAGLSPFHFAREFRRSMKVPPATYLRSLRCDKARELLTSTDEPITEVAAQVGYETPQAFARMFRAHVGTSPSEYRRHGRT